MKDSFTVSQERLQQPMANEPFHKWVLPNGVVWTIFHRSPKGYILRFPRLADFEVDSDGFAVVCFPAANVTDETAQHLYLNQVLPLALSMQGKLVFHGSAVEIGDMAVAFVAESGRGKSTLAADFARNGYRFLTDDGLELEPCGNVYQALPSHPSIRLWKDSEEVLVVPGSETAAPLPYTSKSRFLAGPGIAFCDEPRHLRRVYFLGEGNSDSVIIEPLASSESLMEWVKHSFLLDVEKHSLLAHHFDKVANLARHSIHFRLDYPKRFEYLSNVRQAIIEHAL